MGATRRSLQAQPKILKKLSEHQIYHQDEHFPKKSIFSTFKKNWSQKFVCELPDGICRLNPNPKKMIGTPNLPIKTKLFLKNYDSYLKSVKEPKIRIGATRRNLRAQLKS
jgi:hypothetical protein